MSKILLINPNKWGRGVTHIWIASHSSILKKQGHEVSLFDCTFYQDWSENEVAFNEKNNMYKKSDYEKSIVFNKNSVYEDLQKKIDSLNPEYIFWSAISSHIHGEGEYVNIQYGNDLFDVVSTSAKRISGGLQATNNPLKILENFKNIDYVISGESEKVLCELIYQLDKAKSKIEVNGVSYMNNEEGKLIQGNKQEIISNLDDIPHYDYSIFDPSVFLRPYNGKVVNAIDYEMSRGCLYSCNYCVETIIQKYYGFTDTNSKGTLLNPKRYLRNKSAKRIFEEISFCYNELGIYLFRCQDTNFLTIDRKVLEELADLIDRSNFEIILYIETRPEGINDKSLKLLKKLKVDGIGMGVELSTQSFRENQLNRFADQDKIINAFEILKKNNIKRTAYNIIGLPDQDESSILETIEFNKIIQPDNVTVAYYSPYAGTERQFRGEEIGQFIGGEKNVDSALRSTSQDKGINKDKLNYYKENFVSLVNQK